MPWGSPVLKGTQSFYSLPISQEERKDTVAVTGSTHYSWTLKGPKRVSVCHLPQMVQRRTLYTDSFKLSPFHTNFSVASIPLIAWQTPGQGRALQVNWLKYHLMIKCSVATMSNIARHQLCGPIPVMTYSLHFRAAGAEPIIPGCLLLSFSLMHCETIQVRIDLPSMNTYMCLNSPLFWNVSSSHL